MLPLFLFLKVKLFILFQLGNTKSSDGKINLVHFLAEAVEEKYSAIAGWEFDLSHVEQAAKCISIHLILSPI